MLAFSNTADPLFIFGAVAVGMFGLPAVGMTLALAHYAGAFLVGLAFRRWGRREELANGQQATRLAPQRSIWQRAVHALVEARRSDARPLGQLLNDAIRDSIATLFMIMSFVVLFAVLMRVIEATGLMTFLLWPVRILLEAFGVSPQLASALFRGLFEIDIGTAAAAASHASLVQRLEVVSAIIAWSGLSVHSQVAAVLAGTDIRMKPYMLARLLHAVLSGILTVLMLPWLMHSVPTFGLAAAAMHMSFAQTLEHASLYAVAAVALPCAAAVVYTAMRGLRIVRMRI